MPLGVLIDKDLQEVKNVFVPLFSSDDAFLIDYFQKLIFNSNSNISLLDSSNLVKNNFVMSSAINSLEDKYPENINVLQERTMKKEFLSKQDLMIISMESWKKLVDSQSLWLTHVPSVLILKP
jgi:hypothetical protein